MKTIVLVLMTTFAGQFAGATEALGPHGGKVVQNENHKFEVKFDAETQHVDVYTLSKKKAAPKSMAITLFRDTGSGQTISLKAVNLKSPLPKYQGELSPNAGSYVGAELRFEISIKAFEVLKFIPYIPPRAGRF